MGAVLWCLLTPVVAESVATRISESQWLQAIMMLASEWKDQEFNQNGVVFVLVHLVHKSPLKRCLQGVHMQHAGGWFICHVQTFLQSFNFCYGEQWGQSIWGRPLLLWAKVVRM